MLSALPLEGRPNRAFTLNVASEKGIPMEKTIINIGRGYRLRRYDRRNWVMDEWRGADPSSNLTKDPSVKWRSCDRYFQSVSGALTWVLDHEMLADGGEYDLPAALDRMAEIADSLSKAAE